MMKRLFNEYKRIMKKPANEISLLDKLYLVALAAFGLGMLLFVYDVKEKINERRTKKTKTN